MFNLEQLEALISPPPTKPVDSRGMSAWGIPIELDDAIDAYIEQMFHGDPDDQRLADRIGFAMVLICITVFFGSYVMRAVA